MRGRGEGRGIRIGLTSVPAQLCAQKLCQLGHLTYLPQATFWGAGDWNEHIARAGTQ